MKKRVRLIDLMFLGLVVGLMAGGFALWFGHDAALGIAEALQGRIEEATAP